MIGLRSRVYKDRETDQLARDADKSLRELLGMLVELDLSPAVETKTGFTHLGKPVWAYRFTGNVGDGQQITGIDAPLLMWGYAEASGVRYCPPNVGANTVGLRVLADGTMTLVESGTTFNTAAVDLTAFYTRRDGV